MSTSEPQPSGLWVPVDGCEEIPDALQREGSFVPRPLPSEVALSSRTYQALAAAEQALGRLDEAAQRLPDRSVLVRTTQLHEVQRSAGLDRVHAGLREVLLLDLPGLKDTPAVNPVLVRYLHADDLAFARVRAGRPLDLDLLIRTSAVLSPDRITEPDAIWRDRHAWLGGRHPRDAFLVCAPPGPHLRAATEQCAEWMAATSDLPLVAKVALGHYQLEVLRPFACGAGHLARLYIGLELARAGALRDQILPISMWLDHHQVGYNAVVRRVVDTGDFDEWVYLFAEAIRTQCLEQIRLISQLEELRERLLTKIRVRGSGTSKTRSVLSELISFPVTNHKQIVNRHQLSFKMATEVMRNLESKGLVEVVDNKRYRKVFLCAEAMQLLSVRDPMPPEHDNDAFDGAPS